jgi:hypothetical protein
VERAAAAAAAGAAYHTFDQIFFPQSINPNNRKAYHYFSIGVEQEEEQWNEDEIFVSLQRSEKLYKNPEIPLFHFIFFRLN